MSAALCGNSTVAIGATSARETFKSDGVALNVYPATSSAHAHSMGLHGRTMAVKNRVGTIIPIAFNLAQTNMWVSALEIED